MLKIAKLIPAIAIAIAVAATVAGISFSASANDVDVRTTFSGTAEPGFYYNEGAWVKSEVVPHVMRQTDTKTITSTSPGAGFTHEEGARYTKRVEVPHTMTAHPAGEQTSTSRRPVSSTTRVCIARCSNLPAGGGLARLPAE